MIRKLLFSVIVASAAVSTLADESSTPRWSRFRGENGSASADQDDIPAVWKPENVLWKRAIPGVGASGPIVWGERVYTTAADQEGAIRRVLCLNAADGRVLWKADFGMEGHKKHQKNSFATSTPTTDGERVYVVFTSPTKIMVHCLDAAGKPLWDRDLGPFKGQHGSGASPILFKDRLFVSNEQDGPSFIASLDKYTGKTQWQTPRASEIVAYSTPFVLADEKGDQLIVSSKAGVAALDLATGKPIWHCSLFKQRVVASPIDAGGLIVAHSGSGNKGERMVAVRPGGKGDVSSTHVAWQETKTLPYCPTPLAFEGRLYTVGDSGGLARCLDATTGKELWHERLEGNFAASPIRAGRKLFLVGEKGLVFVIAAEPKFELLGKNALDDYFVATPAVAGNRLYIRGEANLWCIGRP